MNHAGKILFLVLACAWILWREENNSAVAMGKTVSLPATWTMQQPFDTHDECERATIPFGKAYAQTLKRDNPDAQVEAAAIAPWFVTFKRQNNQGTAVVMTYHFKCWPDTVDPSKSMREREEGGR